jgi:hypothetical protein
MQKARTVPVPFCDWQSYRLKSLIFMLMRRKWSRIGTCQPQSGMHMRSPTTRIQGQEHEHNLRHQTSSSISLTFVVQDTILLLLYLDTSSIPSLSSDHCPKPSHTQANQTISPNDKILAPHIEGLRVSAFPSAVQLFSSASPLPPVSPPDSNSHPGSQYI